MAESTLTLTFEDLRDAVYEQVFGGAGDHSAESDSGRTSLVDRYVYSGLRQAYSPPPVGGRAHEWQFLKPTTTLSLEAPYSTGTIASTNGVVTLSSVAANSSTLDGGINSSITSLAVASGSNFPTVGVPSFIIQIDSEKMTVTSVTDKTFTVSREAESTSAASHSDGATVSLLARFPTWAASGVIDIEGVEYTVSARNSTTQLTLDNTTAISDVAAGETYTLHQDDYDLPDDFGRILSSFTFAQSDNASYTCQIVGEARIRTMRQRELYTNYTAGDPQFAAIRTKNFVAATGVRREVMFWPAVSSSATVTYQYRVRPDKPANGSDYLYGASDHSEMLLYSCLAEAERRVDGQKGPMWERFMEALVGSIMVDQRDDKPHVMGIMGDSSDGRGYGSRTRDTLYSTGVTYKGAGSQ